MAGAIIPGTHGALTVERSICLPDDPEWIGIVTGLLIRATREYYWDSASGNPEQAVATMRKILYSWLNQDCTSEAVESIEFREDTNNTLEVRIDGGAWQPIFEVTDTITNLVEQVDIDNAQVGIGRFETTDEATPPTGESVRSAKLYLNQDMLQGTNGTDGNDGKTPIVIHTYKLNPGDSPYFRLATNQEQIDYAGGILDPSSPNVAYVVGLVTGDTGAQGSKGDKGDKGDAGEPGQPGQDCDCGEPVDPTGEPSEAKKCNIVSGGCDYIFSKFDDFLADVQAGIDAAIAIEVIVSGLFDAIPVLGAFPDALLDAVAASITATTSAVSAAFDSDAKETIKCTLYCLIDNDGIISDADYSAWVSSLRTLLDEPLRTPFCDFLDAVDRAKFRTRAYSYSGLTAVCAFCQCGESYDWEIDLDFTQESFSGCNITTFDGLSWQSGKGYVTPGQQWYGKLRIYLNVTATSTLKQVITQHKSIWSTPGSGEANDDLFRIDQLGVITDNNLDFDYPLSVKTRNMNVALNSTTNGNLFVIGADTRAVGGASESLKIQRITFRGNGQKPKLGSCTL